MLDPVRDWPLAAGFEQAEACAADGTLLRMAVGGPPAARRVILLHGAPQFSFCWRLAMAALAGRYRVIAPDLRGYGASELSRTGKYDLETLVGDLETVIEATRPTKRGDDRVLIAAHDWGGPIAWLFAERFPDRVRHLVAANAPHPAAFAAELLHARQAIRSWYIALFQTPHLERVIEATKSSLFLWMMTASSPRGLFSDDVLATYRAALERPGRAEAVLAYYREAFGGRGLLARRKKALASGRVVVPATIVWGDTDKALAPTHPDATRPHAARVEVRHLPGASHWVPEERPEEIVRALEDGDRAG